MEITMEYETLEKIEELREHAAMCGLIAPDDFWRTPIYILQRVYNGIGPERWSCRFRSLTTALLRRFESDALIHDWEYTFQPRNYFFFTVANLRFGVNSIINAAHRYGLLSKSFRIEAGCGILLALLCQIGGWSGFKKTNIWELSKNA